MKVSYLNDEFLGIYTMNIPKDAWMFNMDEDNEKHTQELKTLKKIVKYFKGSEWETVIRARIEEISNAK